MNKDKKESVNARLLAFSAEREANLKRYSEDRKSKKKETAPRSADCQKNIREAQNSRLDELGITRVHPYVSSDLMKYVSYLSTSLGITKPVSIGAIVSSFFDQKVGKQLAVLEKYRDKVIDDATVYLTKEERELPSKFIRYSRRRQILGQKRQGTYLTKSVAEQMNEIRDKTDYKNQGNVVEAILRDFFEEKNEKNRPKIILEYCLEI
jgi:hypothetical protein